jgi:sphingolipid delta-4 desaturase
MSTSDRTSAGRGVSDVAAIEPFQLHGRHPDRAKAILRLHPEVRELVGPNRATFAAILGVVALQFTIGYFSASWPWWLILVVAYAVGALASHSLFVLIHECCHGLVFERFYLNRLAEIVANLPMVIPCASSFTRAHREHHRHLGKYPEDPDVPSLGESHWAGRSSWRKLLWVGTYPMWLVFRSFRTKRGSEIDRWIVLNVVIQVCFVAAMLRFASLSSLLYLSASTWFGISLHPLGARWIQEHFMIAPPQQTYSYYGLLNYVAFNIGYHNEHHDFPRIPWNRLPLVRRLGGQWYDGLVAYRSWTLLLFRFLRDPQFHLHNRMQPTLDPERRDYRSGFKGDDLTLNV